jgi:hypothetical protein
VSQRSPRFDPTDDRDNVDWRNAAGCAHLPVATVLGTSPADAMPALLACTTCSIRDRCLDTVDPAHTWFDGVSGGRLWRNGREVPVQPARQSAEPIDRRRAVNRTKERP